MSATIKNIIIWTVIIIYLIIALSFVSDEKSFVRCKEINVDVFDDNNNHFIDSRDVIRTFKDRKLKVLGYLFDSININRLEAKLVKNPSVKNAEIYTTIDGIVHVDIDQRQPLFRVFSGNVSYYVDKEGYLMTLSDKYTARVIIVNGNVNEPYSVWYGKNVQSPPIDTNGKARKTILTDLYELISFIDKDPFWKAQIQQIYIDKNKDFNLIPKIGDQIIIFGDLTDYRNKFKRLYLFYKHGLRVEGWDKYSIINLKYEDQIVCTKKNNQHE